MSKVLNIFDFSDYREFLRSWLRDAKAEKTSNLSKLAAAAQIHPTFLSHILSGSKELSLEQAAMLAEHLRFTKLETDYFFAILHIQRAGHFKLKDYWLQRKKEIEAEKNKLSERFEKHRQLSAEQKSIFYSSWIYSAVWSATAVPGGQTLAQISERFNIGRERASEIISFLVQTGLCNEKNGVATIGELHIHVPNESPLVVQHHTNWRMKAVQKMDDRKPAELFFTAPMSVSKTDFARIREKLNRTIKELVEIAKESPAEDVVCLNIDFFET